MPLGGGEVDQPAFTEQTDTPPAAEGGNGGQPAGDVLLKVTDLVRHCPVTRGVIVRRTVARATYALMVSLVPATATVIGVVVLAQVPSWTELAGVTLVIAGVAVR